MNNAALVTGAGKRIGREIALFLAKRGHDVVVHYNSSATEAEEVVMACRAFGVRAEAVGANLIVEDDMQALVPNAVNAIGGPLSVLVNSASIFEYDNIETATRESWDRHLESNLRAPFVLTQAFAAQAPEPVVERPWNEPTAQALIVNMVDQRSAQGLAPKVRVNAIGPGPTMQGVRQSDAHFAAQRAATIMQRGADATDVTHALGYFLEAPSVTGQLICVDGGQHLGWKTPDVQGVE
jgi:NAD(P)-dependent dehydrogenase (short-subunit alcohol dehydrogenase family)